MPLDEAHDLIAVRIGETALANLQEAISFLYLVGIVGYDDASDTITYVQRRMTS